jgi:putative intracellular protease/amidase
MDKLAQHRQSPPPSVQALRPEVPAGVAQIVAALMAKRPEDRPASAARVAELLGPFAKGGGEASITLPPEPAAPPIVSPAIPATTLADPGQATDVIALARRHWIATAGVALLLCVLGGFGISRMLPGGDGEKEPAGKPNGWQAGAGGWSGQMMKVVLVVPQQNFWDDDLNRLRPALEQAGAKVRIASSSWGSVTGAKGTVARADISIDRIGPQDPDAIVFLGTKLNQGNEFVDDTSHQLAAARLASEMAAQGKTVAALCAGTAVLAKAGVLRGRRAAGPPYVHAALAAGGATVVQNMDEPLVRDGPILTARDFHSAEQLAGEIVAAIKRQKSK